MRPTPAEPDRAVPAVPAAPADPDAQTLADEAAHVLRERTGVARHDIALVLGSGWGQCADLLGERVAQVETASLPGFRAPSVPGHAGLLRSVAIGDTGRHALILGGRTHLYEGHGVDAVAHGVRVAAAAGCRVLVLTNGCGSTRPEWGAGTVALIADHLNLTGRSPLHGPHFVDLTDLYASRLRAIARSVDPLLPEGVYAQLPGPHYETPAEVRAVRTLGGDLVGMSTALEAIAARAAGLEVLGVSLVTNLGAGVGDSPLSHEEVIEAGASAASRCGQLLAAVTERIARDLTP